MKFYPRQKMKNKKKDTLGIGEILKAINSPDIETDEVLALIMKDVSQLLDAEGWSLLLLDRERKELVFKEVVGEKKDELKGARMPIDKGVVGWTVKNKKPAIVTDPYMDRRFFQNIDKQTGLKTYTILSVPLLSKGKILGIIEAINKKDKTPFNDEDLNLVNNYAEHAAIALENANLVQNLKSKVGHLTLMFDINKTITSILNLDKLLKKSAELIQEAFDYYFVGIALAKGNSAILKGFSSKEKLDPVRKITKGEGLVGKVLKEEKSIICQNTEEEKSFKDFFGDFKSEMVVPIRKGEKLIGLTIIGSPEKFAFSREESKIINEVSYQLGIAIDNATLYEKIRLATITDELTGLHNSRYCNEYLPSIVKKWKSKGIKGSVIFIDLDYFKNINDNYNHLIGSKLLKLIGKEIKGKIKDTEHIGIRYGGDEYVVVLQGLGLEEAIVFTENLKEAITKKEFSVRDEEKNIKIKITASFGIACYPSDSENFYDLLRLSDLAMYYVKSRGRNNIAYINLEKAISLIDES